MIPWKIGYIKIRDYIIKFFFKINNIFKLLTFSQIINNRRQIGVCGLRKKVPVAS